MEVPCTDCDFEGCQNKLLHQVAEARASSLIPSQDGLLAAQDLDEGTLVASFGPVNRVTHRGDRPKLGYTISLRETVTKRVEWVTPCKGKVVSKKRISSITHVVSSTSMLNSLIQVSSGRMPGCWCGRLEAC